LKVLNTVIPVIRQTPFHDLTYLGLFNDAVGFSKYTVMNKKVLY